MRFITPGIKKAMLAARIAQIRWIVRVLSLLNRFGRFSALVCRLRSWPGFRSVFDSLAGYRRVFPSFAQAEAVARFYFQAGHDSIDNARTHLDHTRVARPSDYATLFYLNQLLPDSSSIFDLGGNAGNLFYCFAQYLDFPQELKWTVCDVPKMIEIGKELAIERHEHRLSFTDSLQDADGADVLLASGSSHYFESPLPELLRSLKRKPRYVILNRSPLTDRSPVVTIQDARTFLVVCKIYNIDEIVRGFESLNYDCAGSWTVPDLSLNIPFYPEYSIPAYRGFFFRLRHVADASDPRINEYNPETLAEQSSPSVATGPTRAADLSTLLPGSSASIDTH